MRDVPQRLADLLEDVGQTVRRPVQRLRRAWRVLRPGIKPNPEEIADYLYDTRGIRQSEAKRMLLADVVRLLEADAAAGGPTNGGPASPPVVEAPAKSRGGWMGDVELAAALGVHPSRIPAFRAKLKRMRDKGELSIDDWQEFENPKRNEPQFLYRAKAPAIVAMAKRYSLPK